MAMVCHPDHREGEQERGGGGPDGPSMASPAAALGRLGIVALHLDGLERRSHCDEGRDEEATVEGTAARWDGGGGGGL